MHVSAALFPFLPLSLSLSALFCCFCAKTLVSNRNNKHPRMATPKQSKKRAAKKSGSRSSKAGLIFPVGRIGSMLRRGQYSRRVSASGAVYMAAVLEYLCAELLELTVKATNDVKKRLSPRTLTLAVRHDDELGALLQNVTISRGGVVPLVNKALSKAKKGKKGSATPAA